MKCCGGSKAADRLIYRRDFETSHARCWWPRTENEGPKVDLHGNGFSQAHQTGNIPLNKMRTQGIYILGAGNLGVFVAHSLAGIPDPPPITLLLRRRQLRYYLERDSSIDLTTRGITETRRGFRVEVLYPQQRRGQQVASQSMKPDSFDHAKSNEFPQRHIQLSNLGPVSGLEARSRFLAAQKAPSHKSKPSAEHTTWQRERIVESGLSQDEDESEMGLAESEEQDLVKDWFAEVENEEQQPQIGSDRKVDEPNLKDSPAQNEEIIFSLIVSVKAPQTIGALRSVAHRLTQQSTILFLQNGMGIVDEVNEKVFPDEEARPTYIVGVVSHGLYSTRQFSVVHAGEGTMALGIMPRMPILKHERVERLGELFPSARYILRTMTRTPIFVAVGFSPTDLLQQQLDKLAVNCIINPLTALMDCTNGKLLSSFNFVRIMRLLLAEISLVIKNLPELENVPNVKMRFDTARLEALVTSIATSTATNHSSMLQDVQQGKQSEIDYINGYIVKRGEAMGVHCVINYMIVHLIKGKRKIRQSEADSLPFVGSSPNQ